MRVMDKEWIPMEDERTRKEYFEQIRLLRPYDSTDKKGWYQACLYHCKNRDTWFKEVLGLRTKNAKLVAALEEISIYDKSGHSCSEIAIEALKESEL